jgi:deazaflavin-dependent oxidoreductase (nitroreductase family)
MSDRVRKPFEPLVMRAALGALHIHQAIYDVTDGRVGHRLFGVTCLLLRTTGRRSGATRTSALAYARDGDDYLVVGSLGGADRAPGWLYNARAQPQVGVQVKREHFSAVAGVVEPGDDDYERLWALVNAESGGRYDRYQARTSRPIRVMRLAAITRPARPVPDR